jgi:hypothetical protein
MSTKTFPVSIFTRSGGRFRFDLTDAQLRLFEGWAKDQKHPLALTDIDGHTVTFLAGWVVGYVEKCRPHHKRAGDREAS